MLENVEKTKYCSHLLGIATKFCNIKGIQGISLTSVPQKFHFHQKTYGDL